MNTGQDFAPQDGGSVPDILRADGVRLLAGRRPRLRPVMNHLQGQTGGSAAQKCHMVGY